MLKVIVDAIKVFSVVESLFIYRLHILSVCD